MGCRLGKPNRPNSPLERGKAAKRPGGCPPRLFAAEFILATRHKSLVTVFFTTTFLTTTFLDPRSLISVTIRKQS